MGMGLLRMETFARMKVCAGGVLARRSEEA
jgi:hypothetical protein